MITLYISCQYFLKYYNKFLNLQC